MKLAFVLLIFMTPDDPTIAVNGVFSEKSDCEVVGQALTKDTLDQDYLCIETWSAD